MKIWRVVLNVAYLDGDSVEAKLIKAESGGEALNKAVLLIRKDRAGGFLSWVCVGVQSVNFDEILL